MPFQMTDVILNAAYMQSFVVYRSNGEWVNGRWVEGTPTQITMRGVIDVASEKDLRQVLEGDRIQGAMVFYSTQLIYVTHNNGTSGISDKIMWRNEYYKIRSVGNYMDYGFCKAIGERIVGD